VFPLLIGASTLLLVSACARTPQRLDLVALNGQPIAQAVIDQRECEAEFPFYVRPDRPGRDPSEIRRHIVDCQSVMQQAYRQVSFGYALARELVSNRTFGGNMQRRELIKIFSDCMQPRGYGVGDERHDVVPGR